MRDEVDDQTEGDPSEPFNDASPATEDAVTVDEAEHGGGGLSEIDVVGIEADLDGVQAALTRLADGTYWTDEVTGTPIPADVLAADPLARRS